MTNFISVCVISSLQSTINFASMSSTISNANLRYSGDYYVTKDYFVSCIYMRG